MNWAVVMAGGRGTRFWPESRNRKPKPFLKLLGPQTLLEETVNRLSPFIPPARTLVVLQADLVREARELLKKIPPQNILGEPVGKNTAPCSVWAAAWIEARDPGAKLVFLPADQHITPKSLFQKTLRTAFEMADDRPVLLAMKPNSPQTGFGYLEADRKKRRVRGISCFNVRRFHEKPDLARAKRFLKRGNFFWNGGTFVWRLDAFKKAVRKYAPRIYRAWQPLKKWGQSPKGQVSKGGDRPLERIYRRLPSISLDYAVMEKLRNVPCLLAPFQWSDLGGWEGLARFWAEDKRGNRVKQGRFLRNAKAGHKLGRTVPVLIRSRRNIVKADRKLIALLGLNDLLVVDTPDALLIAPRDRMEEIRDVVKELERRKHLQHL